MQLFHTTGKTWYKFLYQHTMYVINLSNISIKTNFKQITIKINKFVQYSMEDYIFYMTSSYALPFIYQSRVTVRDHFQYHCTIVRQYAFLEKFSQYSCRKYWNYVLEIKIWRWIRDKYYEWMIIKQSLCLCRLHWYVLHCSPMIWRHDKVVRQKRSGATSHHSFITVWWYNILYQTGYFLQFCRKTYIMLDNYNYFSY